MGNLNTSGFAALLLQRLKCRILPMTFPWLCAWYMSIDFMDDETEMIRVGFSSNSWLAPVRFFLVSYFVCPSCATVSTFFRFFLESSRAFGATWMKSLPVETIQWFSKVNFLPNSLSIMALREHSHKMSLIAIINTALSLVLSSIPITASRVPCGGLALHRAQLIWP